MDVEAGEMLPKLVAAVEMVLNPLTPHLQRLEAHQVTFLLDRFYYRPPATTFNLHANFPSSCTLPVLQS